MIFKKLTTALMSALIVAGASFTHDAIASGSTDAQLIERGRYLASVGDCAACHTTKGGKPFAGGLGIASPVGTIYSGNITPDKETGIGAYTLEDFDRAVRQGIAKDGSTLYPAMPYASYAKVKPSDVKALYAYFMNGVQPVSQPNRATDIPWPLSMRWPLRFWRMLFAPAPVADDTPLADHSAARGRYLVEGLGHCGACHTPRGIGLQEKALTDASPLYLSGGTVDGYLAKSLRGDTKDGLGAWSEADIAAFLKSGRTAHSAAFGGMRDVVQDSTQHMSDADLGSIALYLKTLSPVRAAEPALKPDDAAALRLRDGADTSNGALTYIDNCAACHRTSGAGYGGTFPRLALNTVVNSDDPSSLITLVLKGGQMPWTKAAPTHYGMPGFADRLTDRDVADVLTFVRSSWGNRAPAVTVDQVKTLRHTTGARRQPARPENG
ncbi:cytochrome c, class I [Caballeronia arvi]|uniref:Cytochrome c, class I n=1 Tax=Caballeronia arvi TaxID=1777135 RepID=A0A158GAN6_9BURK|nr:cytochrome c, class I [Caballeronia arvi]